VPYKDPEEKREKGREYERRYREKNREKRREYMRRYYEENKEKRREYERRYREKNREKIREKERRYRAENPEKRREYERRYYGKNKERVREWRRTSRFRQECWQQTLDKWGRHLWPRLVRALHQADALALRRHEWGLEERDLRKRAWHKEMDAPCGFCIRFEHCDACPLYPDGCAREYTYDSGGVVRHSMIALIRLSWLEGDVEAFEDRRAALLERIAGCRATFFPGSRTESD